ncbi:MAG: hypothetical protein ACTTH5_01210 [Wolinella sp.]
MRAIVAWMLIFLWVSSQESPLLNVVKLDTRFEDGTQVQGFGMWLEGGYLLSALHAVHRPKPMVFARTIKVMSVDSCELPLIFFGEADPIALDEDRGIALLKMTRYGDAYGNMLRKKHAFHDFVMRTRGVDLTLALAHHQSPSSTYRYPKEQRWKTLRLVDFPSAERFLGAGVFDEASEFVGILRGSHEQKGDFEVASVREIADFICQLVSEKMVLSTDEALAKVCKESPLLLGLRMP